MAGPKHGHEADRSGRIQSDTMAKPSLLGRHSLTELADQSQCRINLIWVQDCRYFLDTAGVAVGSPHDDPQGKTQPNIVLLHGPYGSLPPKMPKSVSLPCGTPASAVHLLSGVGGWNHPFDNKKSVSMLVRLTYDDATTEDHKLINAVHFADYIRRVDVTGSEFAFALGNQQIRYLSIKPKRDRTIKTIELVKGEDSSAPIVMAVMIERRPKGKSEGPSSE
ncbi:hypothetical protein [Thalassoglobus neptunius]|uniref:hypothetical protein n=1 Tax=Thalassoglobus neptunius TaxID=1938619 RepID=UPI001E5E2CD7|nr:hypothetical protein [Thalassoglobus neptunius]